MSCHVMSREKACSAAEGPGAAHLISGWGPAGAPEAEEAAPSSGIGSELPASALASRAPTPAGDSTTGCAASIIWSSSCTRCTVPRTWHRKAQRSYVLYVCVKTFAGKGVPTHANTQCKHGCGGGT